jgi:hypothetical protein
LSKRLLLLPCVLLVSAVLLSACGGGDGDQSKIEENIETSVTSNDPADCRKLETQKFMEQTSQESGKAAQKKCEEEAEQGEGAKSVKVATVEVDGSTATAEAALTGSVFNGQTVEVELIKDGDQWKLNEAVKFTKFDQGKLVESFEKELAKNASEVSPRFAACFIKAFKEADQAEIEAMIFGGNAKAFEEIAEGCS